MSDAPQNRFVVQHHTGYGPEHWDLMLEDGDVLVCWRLERPPISEGTESIPATRLSDHRKTYLTYEGPVSGGRGSVRIFDAGQIRPLRKEPHLWTVEFAGTHLQGLFTLFERPSPEEAHVSSGHWILSR